MSLTVINDDFRNVLPTMEPVRMIFADPPDNIGLAYGVYDDKISDDDYDDFLETLIALSIDKADVIWISYNANHTHLMGSNLTPFLRLYPEWEVKHCVQVYTFGQHNQYDLGCNHRPLIRLMKRGTKLYPDAVRVPSWRQLHGDKRADPRGKVPGDVFDFPRVTGNSKQRRNWCPTQLHEELYERCIKLCCTPEDIVCDLFAGSGTMARVCKQLGNPCILIDIDSTYCRRIAQEHGLILES